MFHVKHKVLCKIRFVCYLEVSMIYASNEVLGHRGRGLPGTGFTPVL